MPPQLLLASTSPRRRELLTQIGVGFETLAVDVDETPLQNESADAYVLRVAAEKSLQGQSFCRTGLPVLGADTEVVLDGQILGKPRDYSHACEILQSLSGREHEVLSGISLRLEDRHWQALSRSKVRFRTLEAWEIAAYWQTQEPCDKAGAYAIQGLGAIFITQLTGSFSGVMGLPIHETAELLKKAGVHLLRKL